MSNMVPIELIDAAAWLSPKAAMSLINKSRPTLRHISVPAVIDILQVVALLPLFHSHFPSLTSFHLGAWVQNPDPAVNKAITLFLIAHPLIRHLSLGFDGDELGEMTLSESAVMGGMLPHLKSFHGHVNNITIMARRGVRSLKAVTALSVGHVLSEYNSDVLDTTAMFRQLESFGGLPELKEFRLEPPELTEIDQINSWMVKLSTVCPGIERLSGALGGRNPVSHVRFLQGEFELTVCHLAGNSIFVVIFPLPSPD
jgi:hypothetical protein